MERTINIKFNELCDEIDFWKSQALYWEIEYKELNKKYTDLVNENITHSNKMMGEFVKFALERI